MFEMSSPPLDGADDAITRQRNDALEKNLSYITQNDIPISTYASYSRNEVVTKSCFDGLPFVQTIQHFSCYDYLKVDKSVFERQLHSSTASAGCVGLGAKEVLPEYDASKLHPRGCGAKEMKQKQNYQHQMHGQNHRKRFDIADLAGDVKSLHFVRNDELTFVLLAECFKVSMSMSTTVVLLQCTRYGDVKHFLSLKSAQGALVAFLNHEAAKLCAAELDGEIVYVTG